MLKYYIEVNVDCYQSNVDCQRHLQIYSHAHLLTSYIYKERNISSRYGKEKRK